MNDPTHTNDQNVPRVSVSVTVNEHCSRFLYTYSLTLLSSQTQHLCKSSAPHVSKSRDHNVLSSHITIICKAAELHPAATKRLHSGKTPLHRRVPCAWRVSHNLRALLTYIHVLARSILVWQKTNLRCLQRNHLGNLNRRYTAPVQCRCTVTTSRAW